MSHNWAPTTDYDKRFYGIYEGTCTNNADPEGKYKIKLTVPQLFGVNETAWAFPCLPVTDNANHPDHMNHTAAQVAAILTTDKVVIGSGLGSVTVPPLTVVPKTSNSLSHPHVISADVLDVDMNNSQHTHHRKVPNVGQKVWIMFIAGDPNFPVWLGVEL
jgi:Type VI secretion system/phage-baseplate injector OB domain